MLEGEGNVPPATTPARLCRPALERGPCEACGGQRRSELRLCLLPEVQPEPGGSSPVPLQGPLLQPPRLSRWPLPPFHQPPHAHPVQEEHQRAPIHSRARSSHWPSGPPTHSAPSHAWGSCRAGAQRVGMWHQEQACAIPSNLHDSSMCLEQCLALRGSSVWTC